MTIKVGINGFGRMGRLGFRVGWSHEDYDIVQVNEIATDAAGSAHLLKYDSVHGTWDKQASASADAMVIDGKNVAYSENDEIGTTDWSGCDIGAWSFVAPAWHPRASLGK